MRGIERCEPFRGRLDMRLASVRKLRFPVRWTWSSTLRDSGGEVCGVPRAARLEAETAGVLRLAEHSLAQPGMLSWSLSISSAISSTSSSLSDEAAASSHLAIAEATSLAASN